MNELELKMQGKIDRLTDRTFRLDPRIGEGYFTAKYFLKVNEIIKQNLPDQHVTMQLLLVSVASITFSKKPKSSYLPLIFKTGSFAFMISPSSSA